MLEGNKGKMKSEDKIKHLNGLGDNSNKLRTYLDVAGVILVAIGRDMEVIFINKKGCEILGYNEEEILGKNWFDNFLPERIRDEVKSVFEKILRGELESVEYYENPVLTSSGEERLIKWHNSVLRDAEGKITGTLSSGEDITEKKKIEEELVESEAKFRAISEFAKDAIIMLDNEGNVSYWNKAAEKIFGYNRSEVIGKELHYIIAPESHREAYRRRFKKFRRTGKGKAVGKTLELTALRKNGNEFPVELSVSAVKIKGEWNAIGIVRDITERKKSEKALKESEERLKTILNHLQVGIMIIDAETHTIVDVNPMAIKSIGTSKEKIVGKVCHRFVCPAEKGACPLSDLGQKIDNSERVLINALGEEIPILKKAVTVRINGREYIIESFVDISERKRLENIQTQLNDALKLINKILRHDILNDLTVVKGSIEIYSETRDRKLLKTAMQAIDKSVKLIRKMRELESVASSGGHLKPISAGKVIKDVVANYDVQINISGDCEVMTDNAFSSVIDNLVRNAVMHGKTKRIDVSIQKVNNFCEIRIVDYGVGIPDEVKDKIFIEGFTHGESGGTGLGLYISSKTIERYGGSLHVEDNKPQGAVFVLRLKRPAGKLRTEKAKATADVGE